MQLRKEGLKNFRLAGIQTLTSVVLTGAAFKPTELARLLHNIPGKGEDEIMNIKFKYSVFKYLSR